MRVPGCEACDRLWNHFDAAGIQLLDLEHRLRLAELQNNGDRAEDLRATIKDAKRSSDVARKAIEEHEATHQN